MTSTSLPLTQLVPGVLVVQCLCCLQRHLNVAALQRQVEARRLICHKVQGNLQCRDSIYTQWGTYQVQLTGSYPEVMLLMPR